MNRQAHTRRSRAVIADLVGGYSALVCKQAAQKTEPYGTPFFYQEAAYRERGKFWRDAPADFGATEAEIASALAILNGFQH